MPDVFISYRRADRAKAETLAKALQVEALDVWWDAALETGQTFDEKIQGALAESKSVVVLWSPDAVKSDWVRAESSVGRERGVLVPVMVRSCVIPVPFNLLHTADLTGWNGDRSHPAYLDVVKQLKAHAGKAHVPPLKPPPNRQMRALWRTVAAVGVLAAIGASLWLFRPWEAVIAANDPAVKAKKARDAAFADLAPLGVAPADFEQLTFDEIGRQRVKPDQLPELQKLADAGSAPAQALACSAIHWNGTRTSESEAAARKYCRTSAEAGDPIGEYYYAFLLGAEDIKASNDWLKKSSDQGFTWAQLNYAHRLSDGKLLAQDHQQAEELLKGLVARGFVPAEYEYGVDLWWGRLGRDYERDAGMKLIMSAADKGDQNAMNDLANRYRDGQGVPADLAKSRALFEALAKNPDSSDRAERAALSLQDLDKLQAQSAAAPQQ